MKALKIFVCSLLCLFCFTTIVAQDIKGKVTYQNQPVKRAIVTVKEGTQTNKIYQYTNTNQLGEFEFYLKSKSDSLVIEVNALGFEKDFKHIFGFNTLPKPITIHFDLFEETTVLNEVVINNRPITKKEDTITYLPSRFKDGSERVIEDLLKKLPGIKVSDNGEVTFKGKKIKKMFLDGDDLFELNYALGTRNIDVNMVQKVQAIENFVENDLLKNLVNSDEVAINIELIKGKTDLSGNATLGSNFQDRHLLEATGLLINKKYKSFSILKNNSIGKNFSSYDLANPQNTYSRGNNVDFLAPKLLSEGNFMANLDEDYERLNTTNHLSNNTLFKIKNNVIRLTFEYLNENFSRNNSSMTNYSDQNQTKIEQQNNLSKKPIFYNTSLFIENKANKSFHWKYDLNFQDLNSSYANSSLNNEILQNTKTDSKNYFLNQKVQFTNSINSTTALMGELIYAYDKKSQDQNIFNNLPINNLEGNQYAGFKKANISGQINFFTSKNRLKYKNTLSFSHENNDAKTRLNTNLEFDELLKINTITYNESKLSVNNAVDFSFQKIRFSAEINGLYFDIDYKDYLIENDKKIKKIFINPSLTTTYTFVKNRSLLQTSISHDNQSPEEQYLLNGLIQTDNRNFIFNSDNFNFSKNWNYNLSYLFTDYFNNRFVTFQYFQIRKKNYITAKNQVFNDYNITEYFLNSDTNLTQGIIVNYEEYLGIIGSTVNFNSNVSQNIFQNIFNESELREVKVNSLRLNFKITKKITKAIFINNSLSYSSNQFIVRNSSNQNVSGINNHFKIVYNIKPKWIFTTNLKYYKPDLNSTISYSFLDSEASYKLKSIEIGCVAKNVLNYTNFKTKYVSDMSITNYQQEIMYRYLMLFTRFKF